LWAISLEKDQREREKEKKKEKGLHSLFSLRRRTDISKLKPTTACKTFDTMISPILTDSSEVWGVYAKPDFKAWYRSEID